MSEQRASPADARRGFDVVPLVVSRYAHHAELVEAEKYGDQIVDMLCALGGTAMPWRLAPGARDQSRLSRLLADWADPPQPRSSVLVWLGHGQALGNDAWLAAYDTREQMRGTGITPRNLCEHLVNEWRRRASLDGAWTLLVIEACGADTFVRLLAANLLEQDRAGVPERLAIIGVGGSGTCYLGEFRDALQATLQSFTDNDREIKLSDLVGRLEDRISPGRVVSFGIQDAAPLPRVRILPGAVAAPLDVYGELRTLLHRLPADVRSHFLPKAQGAEHGEFAWYFVGRSRERAAISVWLTTRRCGMLVVTGRAGAGKSALLGNILAHTNPQLRGVLERAGWLEEIEDDERPPPDAFDAVVHLTGLTTADLIGRIAAAAEVELPARERGADVEWLLSQLGRRSFTLLVDALDESQEPATIASSVLRRIAALPRGRVVVGTRASVAEGPDQPESPSEDLLEALGRSAAVEIIEVGRDRDAIATYVCGRLVAARDAGTLDCDDQLIIEVANEVAGKDRQFLYARLAVHEIVARPRLLTTEHRAALSHLLRRDHRALFAAAVGRLTAVAAVNDPLLEALALARGRGLPRADRVWALVATALAGGQQVTEKDIDSLLRAAAPYIMLDVEDGQSVYRLAHRTFQEHFESRIADQDGGRRTEPVGPETVTGSSTDRLHGSRSAP